MFHHNIFQCICDVRPAPNLPSSDLNPPQIRVLGVGKGRKGMKILRSRRSGGVVNQRFGLLPIQSFINKWVARSALICLRLIAQFSGNLIFWDRLFSCPSVYTFSESWKHKILGFLYQTNSLIQIYKWVARSALICCRLISHLMFSLLAALVFILSVNL